MPEEEEDDDFFGDFKFASSPTAAAGNFQSLPNDIKQESAPFEDDEWGDFVESTNHSDLGSLHKPSLDSSGFQFFDPFVSCQNPVSDPNSASQKPGSKSWKRPKGALPLSLFGEEESPEEKESNSRDLIFNGAEGFSPTAPAKGGANRITAKIDGNISDLIAKLYGSVEQIPTDNTLPNGLLGEKVHLERNGREFKDALLDVGSGAMGSDDEDIRVEYGMAVSSGPKNDDFDENNWEFTDALTTSGGKDNELQAGAIGIEMPNEANYPNGVEDDDFNDDDWEFKDAVQANVGHDVNSEEQKSMEVSIFEPKAFNRGIAMKPEGREVDIDKSLVTSTFGNGKVNFGDLFDAQDVFFSQPATDEGNSINIVNSRSDANSCDLISNLFDQNEQSSTRSNGVDFTPSSSKTNLIDGVVDWDDNLWEFKDSSFETRVEDINNGPTLQIAANESKLRKVVDFYSKLKKESHALALLHIDGLKKAKVSAALSGEDERVIALNEEIQSASANLREETQAPGKVHPDEFAPRKCDLEELLESLQDPSIRMFELEYDLSRQILLTEKDLNSALALFKHASLMTQVMNLALAEEQANYVIAWSKIISICGDELQHGSWIWKQSLQKNIQRELLCRPPALQYFVALAEVYRVTQIMKISATLYRPWILVNSRDQANLFAMLGDAATIWSGSGIKEALEGISEAVEGYNRSIRALLESIKSIHDLDPDALWSHLPCQGDPICRLSLLSLDLIKDIDPVLWNEKYYFVTVANLWANRISCDPPQLPHLPFH